jgi:nucleotide-binding universal stress UspA family protein
MVHYDNIMNIELKGDVRKELLTYLTSKKNVLVIMGAYGRSQLSQFFRRSTADVLIRDIDLPFFITHYKA